MVNPTESPALNIPPEEINAAPPEFHARPYWASAIHVQHVSHAFPTPEGTPLPVLEDVCLDIRPGEFVALLGPSGCGKSTLLRLIAGLEPPLSGTIIQDDAPIVRPDPSRIVVFQDPTLFPWRTVRDNVALGLEAQGVLKKESARVDEALLKVGLENFAKAWPHQLSGGMAQRAALARALVNNPKLLILDEPLGKLDSLTRIEMQSELLSLWRKNGFSVLLVTHDVEEALMLAERIVIFSPRPARILSEISVDLSYPRHRDDTVLTALRHEILSRLGLGKNW
ncbi:MAG: ABC transporter ATP-binding protein [Zoogloeaceae bacterium]|jgi:NitT/TauT family transport system ATP-binding protein|nr:ABC transporter ATP-binding protein [Zoogloeaceae bacterium]